MNNKHYTVANLLLALVYGIIAIAHGLSGLTAPLVLIVLSCLYFAKKGYQEHKSNKKVKEFLDENS